MKTLTSIIFKNEIRTKQGKNSRNYGTNGGDI